MISSLHYRLKSSKSYGSIDFTGTSIRVSEVRSIFAERIGCHEGDIELQDPTGNLLATAAVLPAYSEVLVIRKHGVVGQHQYSSRRSPTTANTLNARANTAQHGFNRASMAQGATVTHVDPLQPTQQTSTALQLDSDLTEEERIQAMSKQLNVISRHRPGPLLQQATPKDTESTEKDDTNVVKALQAQLAQSIQSHVKPTMHPFTKMSAPSTVPGHSAITSRRFPRPPPPSYICHLCGQRGHFIEHCPTRTGQEKRQPRRLTMAVGIPEANLERIDLNTQQANSMVTRGGELVRRKRDREAFVRLVNDCQTTDSLDLTTSSSATTVDAVNNLNKGNQVPLSLRCSACHQLCKGAWKLICCGSSICEDCWEQKQKDQEGPLVTESEHLPQCPVCTKRIGLMDILPDLKKRTTVDKWN